MMLRWRAATRRITVTVTVIGEHLECDLQPSPPGRFARNLFRVLTCMKKLCSQLRTDPAGTGDYYLVDDTYAYCAHCYEPIPDLDEQ